MNRISHTIILIAIILSFSVTAQEYDNLSSLTIPSELITDANAVVRLQNTQITITSKTQLIVKERRIVTVLNESGKKHADAYKHYNEDTRINKLTAILYDASGKKIKKYSKNDFMDISAVDGGTLYSDSRIKILEYTPTSYPYTIEINSEYRNSSTAFIPQWFPIESYNLSVEKNIYHINNPKNIAFRKREKNLKSFNILQKTSPNGFSYSINNQSAIKYERNTLNYNEIVPNVYIAFNEFSLKGIIGKAKNWKEYGAWMYNNLIADRNYLSENTIHKIKELVKDTKDPLEKAKIIYEYVQNKTRYISVQIDIGGWEPIAANKVDKVGYGDCKGLTNYMKALLDVVNIKSYHTIVHASEIKNIDKDFTAMQGNHMILNIPLNGKEIWLECTSQTIPFGFLGDFTDNRDVLVITPEGGIIKRTSSYINEENLQTCIANIKLLPNGNMNASIERNSYGIQYNDKYLTENYSKKKADNYYKSYVWDDINNLEIDEVLSINDKKNIIYTEKVKIRAKSYGTINKNSFLFKINAFNKIAGIPKRYRNRKRALKIDRGFTDKDKFKFILPEGYSLKSLPLNKNITSKFGTYKTSFEKNSDKSFTYIREMSLKKGVFSKEDYKEYRKFRKTVVKLDNIRTEILKI